MAEGDLDTQPWEKYKKPAADKPWERYSAPKPPAETTFSGITGAVTRGLAPVATGAALGAAAGIPFAGVGAIPGAAAGAGVLVASAIDSPRSHHLSRSRDTCCSLIICVLCRARTIGAWKASVASR